MGPNPLTPALSPAGRGSRAVPVARLPVPIAPSTCRSRRDEPTNEMCHSVGAAGAAFMISLAFLESAGRRYRIVDLPAAAGGDLGKLPHIHRILLENVLRTAGADAPRAAAAIRDWLRHGRSTEEIPFVPGRVLMHDTTCGPALVDIAGMRSALGEAGFDPRRLNPVLPVDVSTDHSVAVDIFGTSDALARNMAREFQRNAERYRFMKWATKTLAGVRVHPPGT